MAGNCRSEAGWTPWRQQQPAACCWCASEALRRGPAAASWHSCGWVRIMPDALCQTTLLLAVCPELRQPHLATCRGTYINELAPAGVGSAAEEQETGKRAAALPHRPSLLSWLPAYIGPQVSAGKLPSGRPCIFRQRSRNISDPARRLSAQLAALQRPCRSTLLPPT